MGRTKITEFHDNMVNPMANVFSENVLAMMAVCGVTLVLWLIALPLFCVEGLAWVRSWEPHYIPGNVQGTVQIVLVSKDWYGAQQLPASHLAAGKRIETEYWEKQMSPLLRDAISS